MIQEAIVLAGGMGTRLQAVVQDVPKPMAPVAGRPFLSYLLDRLVESGVSRIILSVHHRRESIQEYFGADYRKAEIRYSIEEQPCGTGGGIVKSLEHVQGSNCLVFNGDSFFDADLSALCDFHQAHGNFALALKDMAVADRYGRVTVDASGRVVGFQEKQPGSSGLINCGIYALDTEWMKTFQFPESFSIEKEFLERIYKVQPIYGVELKGYFIDIGIPESYQEAQTALPALFNTSGRSASIGAGRR